MCTAQLLGSPLDRKQRTTLSRPFCNRLLRCVRSIFTTIFAKNEGNRNLKYKSISYNSVFTCGTEKLIKKTCTSFAQKRSAGDKKWAGEDGILLDVQLGFALQDACCARASRRWTKSTLTYSELELSAVTGHTFASCFWPYVQLSAKN